MLQCISCGRESAEEFAFCPFCGAALTPAPAAREQRKTVTVLFCDVVGSTALGESTDPEALRALLARYFERMKGIVERHGGTVEKFIGDAVMAVFGVPVVHEDDALRAVRVAVEMRDAFPELGVEGRIGVTTGEVVAGTEERLATGDAVNVAARLEQVAQPGEILIGEETLRLVRDAVEVEKARQLELKGKAKPVAAYLLLRVGGEEAFARRLDAPMVGREREQRLLADGWERVVSARSCHLFTVFGAAGVGKSRLVAEFLRAHEDAFVVRGRCLPYGEGITYWPVVEVLKQLPEAELEEAAAAALRGVLGYESVTASAGEIAWAFRKQLEAVASEQPLVCVFDDVHWGEETFLDLVEHVADLSREAPILLLCMARPELLDRRTGWGGGKVNATTVLLEPLGSAETELLIERLAELEPRLQVRIRDAAEGNPLFVEEMVALTQEAGDGDVSVPPTIQALLAARLDQLDARERNVLERGAVEGRIFHRGAVQALAPDELQVTDRLTALVRKELVRPDRPQLPGEDAYRFRHLLIRDAAYDGLPKATRAELHERFADWLERTGADLVELDEILGYHLEQASRYRAELGAPDEDSAARASERLATAARRAMNRSDMPAAVHLFERAAALLPDEDPRRLQLLPALGRALIQWGEWERAEEALRSASEAGREHDMPAVVADAAVELCFIRLHTDPQTKHEEIQRELDDAIRAFEKVDDDAGLARALTLAGALIFWRGESEAALPQFERAAVHARRAGDRTQEMETLRYTLSVMVEGPTPAPAALVRIAELDDRTSGEIVFKVGSLRGRARLEAMQGRLDAARDLVSQARELGEQLGLTMTLAGGVVRAAGEIELLADDPVAAESMLQTACDTLERMGDWGHYASVVPFLSDALLAQDRGEEAAPKIDTAFRRTLEEDLDARIGLHRVAAKVAAHRGELQEAERLATEAVSLAERTDYLPLQGDAYRDLAEVLELSGKKQEAKAALEQALALYERKGNLVMVERTRARLARLV